MVVKYKIGMVGYWYNKVNAGLVLRYQGVILSIYLLHLGSISTAYICCDTVWKGCINKNCG